MLMDGDRWWSAFILFSKVLNILLYNKKKAEFTLNA